MCEPLTNFFKNVRDSHLNLCLGNVGSYACHSGSCSQAPLSSTLYFSLALLEHAQGKGRHYLKHFQLNLRNSVAASPCKLTPALDESAGGWKTIEKWEWAQGGFPVSVLLACFTMSWKMLTVVCVEVLGKGVEGRGRKILDNPEMCTNMFFMGISPTFKRILTVEKASDP